MENFPSYPSMSVIFLSKSTKKEILLTLARLQGGWGSASSEPPITLRSNDKWKPGEVLGISSSVVELMPQNRIPDEMLIVLNEII